MRLSYILTLIAFMASCNSFSGNEDPYSVLKESSGLMLSKKEVKVIEFDIKKAGMKEEGILKSIYDISKVDIKPIQNQLKILGYKKLPIDNFDIGNGFNGYLLPSDFGYFKLKLAHESIIEQLVIVNFTQRKIIIYKTS